MKLKKEYILTLILIAGGAVLGVIIALSVKDKKAAEVPGSGVIISSWQGKGLAPEYYYDIEKFRAVDPKLIKWKETGEIKTKLKKVLGVSVSSSGEIAVCGEGGVETYGADGKLREMFNPGDTVTSVYFGNNIIFSTREDVGVYTAGKTLWLLGKGAEGKLKLPLKHVSYVYAGNGWIYVADSGQKKVYLYSAESKKVLELKGNPKFIVPSPYLSVQVLDDEVYINNQGDHKIEKYSMDGKFISSFGKPGMDIESFSGCCNPVSFFVMTDGKVVTAEKGLPRIKIYGSNGKFLEVVAGPKSFDEGCIISLAGNDKKIYALDSVRKSVRIFERKAN